jgi:hypothetical protein
MTRSDDSPPPSSSQHRDRTRTLFSWSQRHTSDDTASAPNGELTTTGVLQVHKGTSSPEGPDLVKSDQVYRYWYSSPWKPRAQYMGTGRILGGESRSHIRLANWSRQRTLESYIFGTQPRVQNVIVTRVDVINESFDYEQQVKRELKRTHISGYRCDEKLKAKTDGSKLLAYTGLLGDPEHYKHLTIETRFRCLLL